MKTFLFILGLVIGYNLKFTESRKGSNIVSSIEKSISSGVNGAIQNMRR